MRKVLIILIVAVLFSPGCQKHNPDDVIVFERAAIEAAYQFIITDLKNEVDITVEEYHQGLISEEKYKRQMQLYAAAIIHLRTVIESQQELESSALETILTILAAIAEAGL